MTRAAVAFLSCALLLAFPERESYHRVDAAASPSVAGAVEGSWCDEFGDCRYGCCGSYRRQYCCTVAVAWGPVIGGSIGGVAFLGTLIAVICFCLKKHGEATRRIYPTHQQPGIFAAIAGSSERYPPHPAAAGPTGPQAPDQQNLGETGPPGYPYSNPAYLQEYVAPTPKHDVTSSPRVSEVTNTQ